MIKIKDYYFNLDIEYKNIKNMYLRIKNANTLMITCPKKYKREDIIKFIISKEKWIYQTINKQEILKNKSKLNISQTIYYLGKEYQLIITKGYGDFYIDKDTLYIYSYKNNIEDALNTFYLKASGILYNEVIKRQEKYIKVLNDYGYNLMPIYKFKKIKCKWGVCYTNKNTIALNPMLIHYDLNCLESVLWHELLHFIIPNHSKRFHEVLEYHMPKYKEYERELV